MNFNPDQIKIERTARLAENVTKQERLLEKIRKHKELYSPKEEDFIGSEGYSEQEIRSDIKYRDKLKEAFSQNDSFEDEKDKNLSERMKRISDIYEGVIVEQAEQNEWFVSNVNFYPTSEYDDFVNGVDGVAEFVNPESKEDMNYAAMSFDVVFSKHASRVISKLNKTKELINKGKLAQVKYFEDDNGNKKKLLAPRIVLGSRLVSAENLINLWGTKSDGERNKQLAEHPVQIKLLLETYLQAQHFYQYASSISQEEIAYSYAIIANKISDILNNEKSELLNKHFNNVKEDIVYEAIRDYCDLAPSLE